MLFMWMDQNKSGSLSDEDPAIVPCKREENDSDSEENDSDYFESVDALSASKSRPRSRSSDNNSRARKRARKVKSRPRSRRMTSDLEIGEIGLFCILKGFFQENRSTLKQQNIQNPLGRVQKSNFISKHKVILHYGQILLSKTSKSIPATLKIGLKRFVTSN